MKLQQKNSAVKNLMSGFQSWSKKSILKYSNCITKGGIVVGMGKSPFDCEYVQYIDEDTHSLCIGATRSGKSRTVVLQSIGFQGLSGENMCCSDPKGELFQYTYPYLQRLGYNVYTLDFKNPLKSTRYNFLQNVINAVNDNNIPRAIDVAWDITTALVGEAKGERIWNDGEASIIASSILSVVCDNKSRPKYQNLTNVYYFISEMCRQVGNIMPINEYMKSLPQNHPAKALLGISEVAPEKTRGSFFTAALTTLRLFTNPYIYNMTCKSDFDSRTTADEKTAIFIILPDEKTTYYSLASLFVNQYYETLVKVADDRGGRLKNRVNFNLDEFGNFIPIPSFATKLTVGGGRGIKFNLFLQSVAQLQEKYTRDVAPTILGNCQTWIYLRSDEPETREVISKKLGNYTVATSSHSTSYNGYGFSPGNISASSNLTARPLLTPDEVGMIDRPYSLITTREYPVVLYSPDLSKTIFNTMFGLGDEEHNRNVREKRECQRIIRDYDGSMELWNKWLEYQPKSSAPPIEYTQRPSEKAAQGRKTHFKKREGNNDDKKNNDEIINNTVPANDKFPERNGG